MGHKWFACVAVSVLKDYMYEYDIEGWWRGAILKFRVNPKWIMGKSQLI